MGEAPQSTTVGTPHYPGPMIATGQAHQSLEGSCFWTLTSKPCIGIRLLKLRKVRSRNTWAEEPGPRPLTALLPSGFPVPRAGLSELPDLRTVSRLSGPLLWLVCHRGPVSVQDSRGLSPAPGGLGVWLTGPRTKATPCPLDAPGGPSAHGPRRVATGCGAGTSPV